MIESSVKECLIEVLAEVDDAILKVAPTFRIIALSSSFMLRSPLGTSTAEVSHILSSTSFTLFFIGVSVYLSDVISWDTTLSVKSVNVL